MDTLKVTKKSRLPRFKTVQEEAEFWDTHDTTEFEEEFTETRARFARPLDHILAVRLEARTISELARVAERLGIGPSTLVRMWVMEHLRQLGGESDSITPETKTAHPMS